MIFSIKTAGAGAYSEIGGDTDRTALIEITNLSVSPQVQVEPLTRASSPFIENRDNEATSLGISLTIPYTDRETAMAAILTWRAYADGKWDIKLEEGLTVIYFPAAALASYEPVIIGTTITHGLQWISEAMTSTAP